MKEYPYLEGMGRNGTLLNEAIKNENHKVLFATVGEALSYCGLMLKPPYVSYINYPLSAMIYDCTYLINIGLSLNCYTYMEIKNRIHNIIKNLPLNDNFEPLNCAVTTTMNVARHLEDEVRKLQARSMATEMRMPTVASIYDINSDGYYVINNTNNESEILDMNIYDIFINTILGEPKMIHDRIRNLLYDNIEEIILNAKYAVKSNKTPNFEANMNNNLIPRELLRLVMCPSYASVAVLYYSLVYVYCCAETKEDIELIISALSDIKEQSSFKDFDIEKAFEACIKFSIPDEEIIENHFEFQDRSFKDILKRFKDE